MQAPVLVWTLLFQNVMWLVCLGAHRIDRKASFVTCLALASRASAWIHVPVLYFILYPALGNLGSVGTHPLDDDAERDVELAGYCFAGALLSNTLVLLVLAFIDDIGHLRRVACNVCPSLLYVLFVHAVITHDALFVLMLAECTVFVSTFAPRDTSVLLVCLHTVTLGALAVYFRIWLFGVIVGYDVVNAFADDPSALNATACAAWGVGLLVELGYTQHFLQCADQGDAVERNRLLP